MIVIDQAAEERLIEHLHKANGSTRYAQLRITEANGAAASASQAVPMVAKTFLAEDKIAFLLADGEMVVAASILSPKEMGQLALRMQRLGHCALSHAELYENGRARQNLLPEIQRKLLARQKENERRQAEARERQKEKLRQTILARQPAPGELRAFAEKRARLVRPTVMLVDDDAFSRRLFENAMRAHGDVVSVPSGEKAVDAYLSTAPHVLFLDIQLPEVSGLALLAKIRSLDLNAYIIMFSGQHDAETVAEAVRSGARGFVVKPFTREKLLQTMERCPHLLALAPVR